MSIFPVRRGGEEGPVWTFIVAGEDIAILNNQRSPTYLFHSFTLGTQRPEFSVLGWEVGRG